MIFTGYNRLMDVLVDGSGGIPGPILWDKTARAIYEHGAAEPEMPDYWGIEARLRGDEERERIAEGYAKLAAAKAIHAKEVAYLEECVATGKAVMIEYRMGLELAARLIGWRGFQLYRDQQELARASKASEGIED